MSSDRPPAHSFRDLRIWQKALEFVLAVYRYSDSFPQREKFGLVHQLRRAAGGISRAKPLASLFGNLYSKGSQSGNDGSPAANLRHHAGVIGPALQELATQTFWQFRLRLSSRADRESIWSCDWHRG